MAEDDGGGVVMSVVVHLEPGSKANGGPSEPEAVAVTAGDESGSGAATEAEEGDETSQEKGSDEQGATRLHWRTGR